MFEIHLIKDTGHTRSSIKKLNFNCGDKEHHRQLDIYLKQFALVNDETGVARTFVACSENDKKQILGYYSCSMSLVDFKDIPENHETKLPGYPIPALLLGKLAVDKSLHRRDIGKKLLEHLYRNTVDVSKKVGVHLLRVDAKDEEAKTYYVNKRGFMPLKDNSLGLFIPLSTLSEAIQQKESEKGLTMLSS